MLHQDLGVVLATQQRFEGAVECFNTALGMDPRLSLARKKLGQALGALGRRDDADAALETWFDQDPSRLQVALALDHLQAGRKEEAIKVLRKVLREKPDNVDALHTLAQAYWGDEMRMSDIEALLRRPTDLAPALVPAWIMLGTLMFERST